MDISKKAKRQKYKKNWIATKRNLTGLTKSASSQSKQSFFASDNTSSSSSESESSVPILGLSATSMETQNKPFSTQNNPSVVSDSFSNLTNSVNHEVLQSNHVNYVNKQVDSDIADIWTLIDRQNYEIALSNSEDEENVLSPDDLAAWAIKFNIKHNALDGLLKLLRKSGHNHLPATARTLLKTSQNVELMEISGMQYFYFGLEKQLKQNFLKYSENIRINTDTLLLLLNIDGLPIFSSSGACVWPVLCELLLQPKIVFPVVLTFGNSKPKDLHFLHEVIADLKKLLSDGLPIEDKICKVQLQGIVCDAPAKAMVKCVKLYSGYYGCHRCNQKGVWMHKITYQDMQPLHLRTNLEFRNQVQQEHHHGLSPFYDLPVDMITIFSVDYMHVSCLGVMKRLLLIWLRGPKKNKMSVLQVAQISSRLINLRNSVPSVFARRPRGL